VYKEKIIRNMAMSSIHHKVTLNDGNKMPIFGLGVWDMDNGTEIHNAVNNAIANNYMLFDCAQMYVNEEMLGKTLKESGLKREDYFVVSKLNPLKHGYEEAKQNIRESVKKLGLDYIDLYLIHSPMGGQLAETWKAFIELKQEGLIKSIGVSNCNKQHIDVLLSRGMEVPAVNQIELNPWHQQPGAVKYCEEKNIAVMGYCPLARNRNFAEGKYPALDDISKKLNKTKAQVVLRWALQRNFITIPKSSNAGRIKENSLLFDWSLDDHMMSSIDNLDENLYCSKSTAIMEQEYSGN